MKPVAVPVHRSARILDGAQFADAYVLSVSGQKLDAISATRRAIDRAPAWTNRLLRLRNMLVKPLRLKPGVKTPAGVASSQSIGIFPIMENAPGRVVLGLDDRHLDFRLLIDVKDLGGGIQSVTASTVVKTHNLLGRLYLAFVKPFHRIIVPAMLAKVGG
jgi:Protein of unknown function (DUF2867)